MANLENYLKQNGVSAFVPTFNPKGNNLLRAKRFLEEHNDVLEKSGKLQELENTVLKEYGLPLKEIIGGN